MARSSMVTILVLVICALALPLVAASKESKLAGMFKDMSHDEAKKTVGGLLENTDPEEIIKGAVESKNLKAVNAVLTSMNDEQFDAAMSIDGVSIYHAILSDWYEQYHPIKQRSKTLAPDDLTLMLEILQTLEENGNEPNFPTQNFPVGVDDMSPIHIASKLAIPEVTSMLLKQGADPNSVMPDGNTPMHLLADSIFDIHEAGLMDDELLWSRFRENAEALIDAGAILATANMENNEPHNIVKSFKKKHAPDTTPDSFLSSFHDLLIPPPGKKRREYRPHIKKLTIEEKEQHLRDYARDVYGDEYQEPGPGQSIYDIYGGEDAAQA